MSILNQRTIFILSKLIENEYVSTETFMELLNISQRTLYYDISKLNEVLESKNISHISNSRQIGFYIKDDDKYKISHSNLLKEKNMEYLLSNLERSILICWNLLKSQNPITINEFESKLNVSKNTIFTDVQSSKEILNFYGLQLDSTKGYKLVGSDVNRKKLFSFIFNNYSNLIGKINATNEIKQLFSSTFNSEYVADYYVNYFHYCHIESSAEPEDFITKTISNELNKNINENESAFIYAYINSDIDLINRFKIEHKPLYNKYQIQTFEMINNFERIACINIKDKYSLQDKIMTHMIPLITRANLGIYSKNEMKEDIINKYINIYNFSKQAIDEVDNIYDGFIFTDDMISYLVLYFGVLLYDKKTDKNIPKIVIACDKGYVTSQLLKIQIEDIFSKINIVNVCKVNSISSITNNYDYIVTTSNMLKGDNVIKVNSILTDSDKTNLLFKISNIELRIDSKEHIINKIMMKIEENTKVDDYKKLKKEISMIINDLKKETLKFNPTLKDMLNETNVNLVKETYSWEEAIKYCSQPLLANKSIEYKYVDSMIENVKKLGSYVIVGEELAICHGSIEEGVNSLDMSFNVFEEPIIFDDGKICKIMIVLSATDKVSHFNIISDINDMILNKNLFNEIKNVNDKQELLQLIVNK
jgi:transcriptional antiterminator/mannitol/fructose-specific phosphotransferase system IIA component (Ntr-type)